MAPPIDYYSARKQKWLKADKPAFVIGKVEVQEHGEDISRYVADYCNVFDQMKPEDDWRYGQIFRKTPKGNIALFTHSFSLSEKADETAKALMACGGLLFPSIAVSTAPAPEFMPGVLILDPRVVLNSLKPYRGRGKKREVVVFNGDAWTPTTQSILGTYAAHLYDELTGNRNTDDYMYNYAGDFYIEGIVSERDSATGLRPAAIKTLDSEDALLRKVDFYASKWPVSALQSARKFATVFSKNREAHGDQRKLEWFSFVEAKASCIVSLECVRVAVVPRPSEAQYTNFLRSAGYTGEVITQDVSSGELRMLEGKEFVKDDIELQRMRLSYAHAVVRTVAEWDARRMR